ncbi:DNA-protecting protein DprA [Patescibacteria group bacterium]|jgi:DNA processing protein|nr:DNA-protecting protein DprA [Patescibacteria group bacterium]
MDLYQLRPEDVHPNLTQIPEPPAVLWCSGTLASESHRLLAIVGSRRFSRYGQDVCEHLITGLAGAPVSIVSGLALGIDGIAHRAALSAGLHTLAIPGSGLGERVLYPAAHRALAAEILAAGGGLLSEFPPEHRAARWTFPKRNRLMAGLAHATLLIEAGERSGTLITARLASDYDRELMVVPGSIFAPTAAGVHQFLKLGATPVTSSQDILDVLRIDRTPAPTHHQLDLNKPAHAVLAALDEPCTTDELAERTGLSAHELNTLLTQLELSGHVEHRDGMIRKPVR